MKDLKLDRSAELEGVRPVEWERLRLPRICGTLLVRRVRAHRVLRLAESERFDRLPNGGGRVRRVVRTTNGGVEGRLQLPGGGSIGRGGGVEQRPLVHVAHALLGHFVHLHRALQSRSLQLFRPNVQNLKVQPKGPSYYTCHNNFGWQIVQNT